MPSLVLSTDRVVDDGVHDPFHLVAGRCDRCYATFRAYGDTRSEAVQKLLKSLTQHARWHAKQRQRQGRG